MKRINPELCVRCKGYRLLCGLDKCPILEVANYRLKSYLKIRSLDSVYGSTPPSLIVGEYGYPKVRVLFNIPHEVYGLDAKWYDDPVNWWGRLDLEDIIRLRTELIATGLKLNVKDPWKLYEMEVSLASVSINPVDSEAKLAKKPIPKIKFNGVVKPVGLYASAESIKVTSNPYVNPSLEKLIHDDVKASDAIVELYLNGLDIYTIINALSSGLLGRIRDRKLVPTRWAITAVDSTLGNFFKNKVREFKPIDRVLVFRGEYLGNKFTVVLVPGLPEIEWIEAWHPSSLWVKNSNNIAYLRVYEDYRGSVSIMDGGYYAARLPVLEYLYKIKRSATVFIFREILPSYYAPVGNWHIRETIKHILKSKPIEDDILDRALIRGLKHMNIPVDYWIGRSMLLKDLKYRTTLDRYLKF